ncbi:unnamed protein product [Brachionus calyciflorus]|uniref:G-protein coupled receptors family 1 profile domain-containing protein n=1 Tax=Brachionus calyciflorus TaxID=104777 RepID=A0A813ST30_9BILA|nr:unnamed protein product [Brachionus calyciflorus]
MKTIIILAIHHFLLKIYFQSKINQYCKIDKYTIFSTYSKLIQFKNIKTIDSVDRHSDCLKNENLIEGFCIVDQNILQSENLIKNILNLSRKIENDTKIKLVFIRVSGFVIEEGFSNKFQVLKKVYIGLKDSELNFYFRNKLIKSCDQLNNVTINHLFNSINLNTLEISKSIKLNRICPLIFQNSKINAFLIDRLVQTFYMWQYFKFDNYSGNSILDLNSDIQLLILIQVIKIKLDQNLINPYVFKSLSELRIFGEVLFVQKNLFLFFPYLKLFKFDGQNFRKFMHRIGIDWIKYFNRNINLDPFNFSGIFSNYETIVNFLISFNSQEYANYYYEDFEPLFNLNMTFPEQDFCIYKNFPFNQLIHIYFDSLDYDSLTLPNLSCTTLWLIYRTYMFNLYYNSLNKSKDYFEYLVNASKILNKVSGCQFEKRINLCSLRPSKSSDLDVTVINVIYYTNFFDGLIRFYLIPISSFIGLIVYLTSVYVLKKSKALKDKNQANLFFYIFTISIINSLICFSQLFRLIPEWPYGLSNKIMNQVFAQYLKIILFDFSGCILKFCSNFVYVVISIIRCSYIGDKPEKFFVMTAKLNPKKLIASVLIVGFTLSFIKLFNYEINYINPVYEYPTHISFQLVKYQKYSMIFLITALNLLIEFINGIAFLIVNLVLDLVLIFKLKKTIRKQANTFSSQNLKNKRMRAVMMKPIWIIVINVMLVFLLRTLEICDILYSNQRLIFILYHNHFINWAKFYYFFMFCIRTNLARTLQIVSNFCFIFSLTVQFLLYSSFNNNFRTILSDNLKFWKKLKK